MKISINFEITRDKKEKPPKEPKPKKPPRPPMKKRTKIIIISVVATILAVVLTPFIIELGDDLFNKDKTGRAEAEAFLAENYYGWYFIEGFPLNETIRDSIYVSKDYAKLKNGYKYEIKLLIVHENSEAKHYIVDCMVHVYEDRYVFYRKDNGKYFIEIKNDQKAFSGLIRSP